MIKSFVVMIEKGAVKGPLNLLTNISNGILLLDDNRLQLLHEKHPLRKLEMINIQY